VYILQCFHENCNLALRTKSLYRFVATCTTPCFNGRCHISFLQYFILFLQFLVFAPFYKIDFDRFFDYNGGITAQIERYRLCKESGGTMQLSMKSTAKASVTPTATVWVTCRV
jgi:hypothetical protein